MGDKNILIVSGSPRKGNTEFVLNKIFESLDTEKELVLLREKNIEHCSGCLYCDKNKKCFIKDDMQEIYRKMLKADVLILGTPNYFDNVSGLMKDFMDRTNPFYETGLLKGKKVITIVVGGGDVENSKKVGEQALRHFVGGGHNMEMVGNYYFQALHADELENNLETKKELDGIVEDIKEKIY